MAIVHVGSTSSNSLTTNGGALSLSVTMPTIQAGDFAIIAVSRSGTSAINTTPTGFTLLTNTSVTTTNTLTIWFRKLAGTESGTVYTAGWASSAYSAMGLTVYRGVNTSYSASNPPPFATAPKSAASAIQTYPAANILGANSYVVAIAGTMGSGTSGPFTHTPPTSYNERFDTSSQRTQTTDAGIQLSDITISTLGTYTPPTGSSTINTTDVTATIALVELQTLTGVGILTSETFGLPAYTKSSITTTGVGILSSETHGIATSSTGTVSRTPTAIGSAEASGIPRPSLGSISLTPISIDRPDQFGNPTITVGSVSRTPTAILTAYASGLQKLTTEVVSRTPTGIGSLEAAGNPTMSRGSITLGGIGIASGEAVGTPFGNNPRTMNGIGIGTAEASGIGKITAGAIVLTPPGISAVAVGIPTVATGSITLSPVSIVEQNVGTPSINMGTRTLTGVGITTSEIVSVPTVFLPEETWNFLPLV